MHLFLSLLFTLLLGLPLASHAQQIPPEVERLRAGIAEADQLLEQVKQQRETLRSLYPALQDSAALMAGLDSLQQKHSGTVELKYQQDSLRQAFTNHQNALRKLDEAERRLREEIAGATEALAREQLPAEAASALRRLEQAGEHTAKSLLPEEHLLNQLPKGLPATEKLQGEASARALKAAGNNFAGHQDKLNQARRKLDKYKGRFEKVESMKDMPKGFLKLNPLKGKPLPERVVLGTLWQFANQDRFLLDLGSYAAWRFTDKVSSGAGFQYRLSVSVKEKPWVSGAAKVLGYYAFTDVDMYKGFYGRLHYENLSTPVPLMNKAGQVEGVEREWVPGLSVGAGRRYTFYKQVKGYAVMQYNLLHRHNHTPYLQPVQAKIGFYIFGSDLLKAKHK